MSPLHIEVFSQKLEEWIPIQIKRPGEATTISNNPPGGNRELYIAACVQDDSHSVIYRQGSSLGDVLLTNRERLVQHGPREILHVLERGESIELTCRTDGNPNVPAQIRLSHRET